MSREELPLWKGTGLIDLFSREGVTEKVGKHTPSLRINPLIKLAFTLLRPCSCAIACIPAQVEIFTGRKSRIGRLNMKASVAAKALENAASVELPLFVALFAVLSVPVAEVFEVEGRMRACSSLLSECLGTATAVTL